MNSRALRKMILSAVMTALVAVATAVISIPLPTGYGHPGDALVLLSGWLLGPLWGAAAAGLGSAMADVFLGYVAYAPATFVVKALTAAVCALLTARLAGGEKPKLWALLPGGLVGESVMVGGYFLYESLVLRLGVAAAASLPGNLMQGAVGLVLFVLLAALLRKARLDTALRF